MPRKRITEQSVRALKVPERRRTISEDGLTVEIFPSGKISFYHLYRQGGKRHKERLGSYPQVSVKQAKSKVLELQHALKIEDAPVRQSSQTLREFIEGDFQVWCLAQRKQGKETMNRLRYQYLGKGSRIADLKLRDIGRQDIEEIKSGMMGRYEPSTVKRTLGDLRRVFTKAVDWGQLRNSPATVVSDPRIDPSKEKLYLSDAEIGRLDGVLELWLNRSFFGKTYMERAAHPKYLPTMVRIAINTGMRKGEIISLRWCDIDEEGKIITVRGVAAKSGRTRRIPISDKLLQEISSWTGVGWREYAEDTAKVFQVNSFKRSWDRLRKEAHLEHITFHQLRHHFASKLVLNGTALHVVQRLLGHASIETTQRYLSVRTEDAFEAVNTL